LAAVLWNGGISFGGVIAFIFADLIILPILVIYRKYYGTAMTLALAGIFYAAMAIAGYITEFAFGGLGLIPAARHARVTETGVTWNYTTILNIVFLLAAAALVTRFARSGAGPMLKMMGGAPAAEPPAGSGCHAQHQAAAGPPPSEHPSLSSERRPPWPSRLAHHHLPDLHQHRAAVRGAHPRRHLPARLPRARQDHGSRLAADRAIRRADRPGRLHGLGTAHRSALAMGTSSPCWATSRS
jgi:hypothetical protein